MNNFTWFKLLVRAIGLLLIGLSIPGLLHTLVSVVHALQAAIPNLVEYMMYLMIGLIASGMQLAFGAYLLLGGRAIIDFCLRDIEGRCPRCAYDLRSVTGALCPECGLAVTPVPAEPPATSAPSGR